MRLLLLAGNYAPEKTASAPLSTDFARYMRAAGHEVSVVTTFPHYPEWKVWKGYEQLYRRELLEGVTVRRIRHYIPAHPTALKRILYYGSFGVLALPCALASRRHDVVLCVTPPLELAVSAYVLSLLWGVPFVLWIKDLVPDVAIRLGMLRNPALIRLAHGLERFAYGKAAKLLVIGPAFQAQLLAKGVPADKVQVLPDWVNTGVVRPDISGAQFRRELGLGERDFVVLYAGNIGQKQKLEVLVRAAKELESSSDIKFLIVGDGARKQAVVAEAERLQAYNVRFLPLQPDAKVAEMLAASDVLVLCQQAGVVDCVLPSKLLMYMASGRPAVVTAPANSVIAASLSAAGAGATVDPEQPALLAEAIMGLYRDPARRHCCGDAARSYVCRNFGREVVLARMQTILSEVVGERLPVAVDPEVHAPSASEPGRLSSG